MSSAPLAVADTGDRAFVAHDRTRRDAARDPDVAADDAAVPDDGIAAQDRGVGIDHHVVAHGRVALRVGQFLPHAGRAQRDALVELHAVADDRRLAHHHAGAVVDAEGGADAGARVNVDAGFAVGKFADEPGHQRHTQLVQGVGDAVQGDGAEAGIGEDDLVAAGGGGVALVMRLGVAQQRIVNGRQLRHEPLDLAVGVGDGAEARGHEASSGASCAGARRWRRRGTPRRARRETA